MNKKRTAIYNYKILFIIILEYNDDIVSRSASRKDYHFIRTIV